MKTIDLIVQAADYFYAKASDRGDCVFPAGHSNVTDGKDHFPVNNEEEAHAALGYANHYHEAPPWYNGSLTSLLNAVVRKVKNKFPSIKVSEKSSHPGKD